MKNIAIIGGGITGLAIAYYLARQGQEVTVFEKEEKTGGLAASFDAGPFVVDKYYRHIFAAHGELLDTIRSLGLEDRLVFKKASMAYFSQGRIYPMNSAMDLLLFTPLRLRDRLRVGISASAFLLRKSWQAFDGMTAAALLKKKCGDRGYSVFWEPLLKNKFGDHAAAISATWLWDRMQSRARGQLGRSSGSLGYLRGGFNPLFERMEAEVVKHGGQIMTRLPVVSVERPGGTGGAFILNGDPAKSFQTCIVSLPLPQFVEMVPALPRDYREQLARIDYSHSVCMVLRLKEPLSQYYWINIGDEHFPFAVVVEHTNWMGSEDYLGQHVVHLSRYCNRADDFAWTTPDAALFDIYCGHLKKIFKDFRESQVLGYHVCRDLHTQPVFKTHYSRVLPPFATPVKDLFLADTSQFYPRSRCMNTSFILAREFLSRWREMEDRA